MKLFMIVLRKKFETTYKTIMRPFEKKMMNCLFEAFNSENLLI
jgi:hypothetical protein